MAQVPVVNMPDVSPNGGPIQGINPAPPPEAFGAIAGGEALQSLGKTEAEQADVLNQHAEAFQAINNKQAADSASIAAAQAIDQAQTDYHANNKGMAAVDNLADFQTKIENIRQSYTANLSPMAANEYDSTTRRYAAAAFSNTATFAAAQRSDAVVSTSQSKVKLAQAQAVTSDDPNVLDAAHQTIANEWAYRTRPDVQGLSEEDAKAGLQHDIGAIYVGKIKVAFDGGDYPKAAALYDANKDSMDANQTEQVAGLLRTGGQQFEARSAGEDIYRISQGTAPVGPLAAPSVALPGTYLANVIGREDASGNPNAKNPNSSATGTGQFVDKTWRDVMHGDPQFAAAIAGKTDAQILALRNDPDISAAATLSYAASNAKKLQAAGYVPSAANVGMAHGFGPEGAEAILAATQANPNTPVANVIGAQTAANNGIAHATVGQVVSGFQKRFGISSPDLSVPTASAPVLAPPPPINPNGDLPTQKAAYDNFIDRTMEAKYANNPPMIQSAIASAKARMADVWQGVQATQEATTDRLVSAMATNPDIQSRTQLALAYPNATSDIANAPPSTQARMDATLRANSNYLTPAKQQTLATLEADSILNPQHFAQTDLSGYMDQVRPSDFVALRKTQDNIRAKGAAAVQSDSAWQSALRDPQTKIAMQHLGIPAFKADPTADNTEYNQFAAALKAQMDNDTAQLGRPLHSNEQQAAVAKVTAAIGAKPAQPGFMGSTLGILGGAEAVPGTPAYRLTPADQATYTAYFKAHGIPNPTDEQIQLRHLWVLNHGG